MTPRADSETILHAVDDKPGWGLSLLLGLTHVSLIFDGIIFLPIMIGKATPTPAEQVAFVTFATIVVAALWFFDEELEEVIRIISAREATARERAQYEEY